MQVQCLFSSQASARLRGADSPSYFDTIDYGKKVSFNAGAQYDVFGVNPAMQTWMIRPTKDKAQRTIETASRSLHGPKENLNSRWTRSEGASEIVGAVESAGGFAYPTTPHRPKSNIAE